MKHSIMLYHKTKWADARNPLIRIFLNKFCGYYFPDQDYDICMKPFIYKPVVDPDERRRKETKLMATIKAITLMGNEIKFDLIDDLVKDSFAIIRPNTF